MAAFRAINGTEYGTERYRPVQLLNSRKVIDYSVAVDDDVKDNGEGRTAGLISSTLVIASTLAFMSC